MEQTMGKRIIRHRKALGLTQEQLAEKLGVTAQAVSKWENDQSCPDIYMLPKLAELFQTTTDELLGINAAPAANADNEEEEKNGWELHIEPGKREGIGLAIYILIVGALIFASRYMGWDVSLWSVMWPSALLVGAVLSIFKRIRFTNCIVALVGAWFLVNNLGVLELSINKSLIFPALIVMFGLCLLVDILFRQKSNKRGIHKRGSFSNKGKKHFVQENERFECVNNFGETMHRITLPRLSGGRVDVCFGEMEIDLTPCGEIAEKCEIEVAVNFGELSLKVPGAYNVVCTAGTSFSEITISGSPNEQSGRTIILCGDVNFGELSIEYV